VRIGRTQAAMRLIIEQTPESGVTPLSSPDLKSPHPQGRVASIPTLDFVELVLVELRLQRLTGGRNRDPHRWATLSCITTAYRSRTRASRAPLAHRVMRSRCAIRA
jgi:hypothetical protein